MLVKSEKSSKPEGFVVYSKTLQSALLLPDDSAGRVLKAAARLFLTGEAPGGLELSEKIVLSLFTGDIDSALIHHAEVCARNQRIAANRKAPSVTSRHESLPVAPNRTEIEPNRKEPKRTESKESKADRPPTRPYGQYGWVKLTDEQHAKLLKDLGQEELERCIAYVDESAQATGNKNKWKDWNLTLRKCHRDGWGVRPQYQQRAQNQSIELEKRYKMMGDWANE